MQNQFSKNDFNEAIFAKIIFTKNNIWKITEVFEEQS